MANPVAAHTFDFVHIYLSTRTGGAPGSGTWSIATVLFDGTIDPINFLDATTFSSGGLESTDPYGIISQTDSQTNSDLTFLGNGDPTTPIRISFTGQHSGISSGQGYWNTTQGAFQQGGSFFCATVNYNGSAHVVTVLKSADGSSPWAVQDGSNGPAANNADGQHATIQRVDNYLFFFVTTDNTGAIFAVFPFNMTAGLTGLWETASTAIPLSDWASFGIGGVAPSPWTNGVIKFLNGNFLIFYNTTGNVPTAILLSGGLTGTWGSPITLPGAQFANCVIDPALNLVHIFTYGTAGQQSSEVHYSTIAQDGTLTSDITQIPAAVTSNGDGVGHSSIQNGMLFVPRDDPNDFDNAVWVATLPVSAFSKELLPVPPGENNTISAAAPNALGSGYALNDTGTIPGGLTGYIATYRVNSVWTNGILTLAINAPGGGYAPGDTFTVNTGSTHATGHIISAPGGVPDNIFIDTPGNGYSISSNVATTTTSGGGSGLTIDINSLISGAVRNLQITNGGGGYSVASNAPTATGGSQPGSGTGLTINITAVSGKTPSCAYMMFPNGYSLTPGTISIACPVAPLTAQVGVPFVSDAPIVTGDTPPDHFDLVSGPPWMTIDPLTGVVRGTPASTGSFPYTIKVTDSLGNTATVAAPCPLTVSTGPPPPAFCIVPPVPVGQSTAVAYTEPTELEGS